MMNSLALIWFSVFRFILSLLHFTYSVYEYFDLQWNLLKKKLINIVEPNETESWLLVSKCVSQLQKCPTHFLVIVGEDGICPEDFSNLVIWCLAANISFVSFYDFTGYLKAQENIYYKHLIDKRKLDPRSIIYNLEQKNIKNGITPKIHLNILSMEDGKPLFIKLTKNLATKVMLKELKVTDIEENLISKELLKLSGMPEPELGVVTGTICGTFGYVPWHLRITEFIQVKSLKGVHVTEFTTILKKYSSCTQRFGK